MRSVIEEKSTRILEVLLSSVTSKELLAGKILGVGAVGLTQILVWVTCAALFSVPGLIAAKSFLGEVHIPHGGHVRLRRLLPAGLSALQLHVRRHRLHGQHRPGSAADAVAGHDPRHPVAVFLMNAVIAASQRAAVVLAFDGSVLRADSDAGAHADRAAAGVADWRCASG